jgi:UDP-2,3-diacylglucosamine hydrolase
MKIAAISDVHVKAPHDEADTLLMKFFRHPEVQTADYVLLLGDIFDLMVGPHDHYLKLYPHFFSALKDLQEKGKRIIFFEGNHDVHLEKLFRKFCPENPVFVTQKPVTESIEGKKYYFSHGDEHEVDNISYHRYIRFIRSKPLKFVADYLMPYRVLNFFGERASKASRKKGSKYFDTEKVRSKFRQGVEITTQGNYDFVLGGHSHVQDLYSWGENKSLYVNNGYALNSKTFILIKDHNPEFVPLS